MQHNDKIGALFSNLLNDYEEKVSFDEMDKMYATISKNQFLSFSLYHFNIYYAAVILSGFLFSVSLGCYYLYTTQKNTSTATVLSGTGPNPDKRSFNSPLQPAMEKQTTEIGPALEKHKSPLRENKQIVAEKAENNDELSGNNTKESIAEISPNSKKNIHNDFLAIKTIDSVKNTSATNAIKKKVFIIQKDTIYQTDTLKAKSRKRIKG